MDPRVQELFGFTNGISFQSANDHTFPLYSNYDYVNALPTMGNGLPNLGNGFVGENNSNSDLRGEDYIFPDPNTTNLSSNSRVSIEDNLQEDFDFSDSVLRYINQILVEEDVEGKGCMLQESLKHQALQDGDKSLYRPELESQPNTSYFRSNLNSPSCCFTDDYCNGSGSGSGSGSDGTSLWVDPIWAYGKGEYCSSELENAFYQPPLSSSSSTSVYFGLNGELVDSHSSYHGVPPMCVETPSILNFKGFEVANKFLCDHTDLLWKADEKCNESLVNPGLKNDEDDPREEWRVRKHTFENNMGTKEEERCTKKAAIFDDSDVRSDMFDKILLHHGGDQNELIISLRATLQTAAIKNTQQNDLSKGSGGSKGRSKKQGGNKEVVDLRSLLTSCAQSAAADDRRTANGLLKKIRENSSPLGDGNQRLAHYLADGLEARLAGTGSQIYQGLTNKRTNASDVLKAYLLYLAACPFRKLSNFFSNKSIAKLTRKATKIHIIDFGILYGFQWPTFIQRQSMREGGPPKIKITGIDFPQPGFRPAERVEETGRRLENYAQEFRVPFEYCAIAKRWDTIQPEDFDIADDEVLIVNCIYRLKNLPDETVSVESSRNIVLKMMRKLNPTLFIHGVVNGAYSAPFFVTRFREALFHFSAQFDMLETVVPREYGERMLIERDLLAREALNVVACEGWERVERPETYKQWKIRTIRAGFNQLPLDLEIKERASRQVHSGYHKDFMIDEDNKWLLLGWKGRVLFALSTWKCA